MENLLFSLNATIPVFLLMMVGYFLRKTSLLDDQFADKLNVFVFQAALPVLLFQNLSETNFHTFWNGGMVLFCLVVSLISILVMVGASLLLKDKSIRAEFIQGGYRGSQALLGAALFQNIYGGAGPLALTLIGAVPLYNVAAVITLTLLSPGGGRMDRNMIRKSLRGIVTNPIILAIAAGLIWALLGIPQPAILQRTISSFAATATPLGLIALGASINVRKAASSLKLALVCSVFKLIIFVGLFLPVAVWLGYRNELLVGILIMLASPATVSCFTMARSMGHDGTLSSSTIVLSTLLSAFTLTGWLYLLRQLSLI